MPPTLGFLPHVFVSEDASIPFARPALDAVHIFLAPLEVPAAIGEYAPASPEEKASRRVDRFDCVRSVQRGGSGSALSRCRLRIFRNGTLGRPCDCAVLISELPPQSSHLSGSHTNPGSPARPHLDQLATEIKRTHLTRFPAEEIAWFYHQEGVMDADRPLPHDHPPRPSTQRPFRLAPADFRPQLDRIQMARFSSNLSKVYFGFALEPCSLEDLKLAAGGLVQL